MQRRTLKIISSTAALALSVLALAGCATETGAPADDPPPTDAVEGPENTDTSADKADNDSGEGSGEAVLSYGDTAYTAQLTSCLLQGGEEALFQGPATNDSGADVGYLSGDFGNLRDMPYGEARLDFGATGPLESTDEIITLGDSVGHIVVTASDDNLLIVVGGVWDQHGEQLGTGTLNVSC